MTAEQKADFLAALAEDEDFSLAVANFIGNHCSITLTDEWPDENYKRLTLKVGDCKSTDTFAIPQPRSYGGGPYA